MTKSIDTLIEDINAVFLSGATPDESVYKDFGDRMATFLKTKIEGYGKEREFTLRMSNLGKPDTQLYYASKGEDREELEGHHYLKFLYGDLIEELLLALAVIAGHSVELRQEEVTLNGVTGHIDAVIDGEVVDVKSASTYSFNRFEDGSLRQNDSFGYISQISSYAQAMGKKDGYFLACDKTLGHMCLLKISGEEMPNMAERIDHIRTMLASPTPPPSVCSITKEKNGNECLSAPCSYCPYKGKCHPQLRTFLYSTGPKFFTKVESEPRVMELKGT